MASKVVSKMFSPKKTKFFWCYFILAALLLALGIIFMPVWGGTDVPWKSWGNYLVYACIGVLICIYLFAFLVKKIASGSNGTVKVLTIVEFVIMAVIAVGCILLAIPQIQTSLEGKVPHDACRIIGIALYCRGVVEVFRAYYYRGGTSTNNNYPVWWLVIAIVFITLGVWMFVAPFFSNNTVIWIIDIVILLLAVLFFADGFLAKPKK